MSTIMSIVGAKHLMVVFFFHWNATCCIDWPNKLGVAVDVGILTHQPNIRKQNT